MEVEIIIPCRIIDKYVVQCIENCLKLNFNDFRILLIPDNESKLPFKSNKLHVLPAKGKNPASKRNLGIEYTLPGTRYLAFIDADAFPDAEWLKNALAHFNEDKIYAVGGPNLTPQSNGYLQRLSGSAYEQYVGFANGAYRHRKSCKSKFVNELPACNLIIRKAFFESYRFDEDFLAAEDNKLCGDIINQGFKIKFAHDVIVHHHRRKFLFPLLNQVYTYGYYRAKLTSYSTFYPLKIFLPTGFSLYIMTLATIAVLPLPIHIAFFYPLFLYFVMVYASSFVHTLHPIFAFFSSMAVFACHFGYGSGFLSYFLTPKKQACTKVEMASLQTFAISTSNERNQS